MYYYKNTETACTTLLQSTQPMVGSHLQELTAEQYLLMSSPPQMSEAQIFESERLQAAGSVVAFCSRLRERIAKSTHYLQASRWAVQLAAAQDVLGAGIAALPMNTAMLALEARLRQRGETVEQLAQKVISNSSVFTLVGAAVDGIETATLDAISDAYINGDSPAAFAELTAQARETARTELLAIFTAALSETEALPIVSDLLGD